MGWFRNLVVKITGDKSGLDSSLKGAESSISRFGGAVKKIGGVIAAAFTVGAIANFTKDIIGLASRTEGVKAAFDRLNNPELLMSLRRATRGTVSDLQLMQKAIQAQNFKIPLSQLATYFEFATKRAIQTGESVDYLVDSIIMGIGHNSPRVLDNLGISLASLQEEMEKTGNISTAVGNVIQKELTAMGDVADTTATKMASIKTAIENIKTGIGMKITESSFFQGLTNWINNIGKFAQIPGMSIVQAIYGATFKPKEINQILDETNKKIAENAAAIEKQREAAASAAAKRAIIATPGQGSFSHLKVPSGISGIEPLTGLQETIIPLQEVSELLQYQEKIVGDLTMAFEDMFSRVGEGFDGMIDSLVKSLQRWVTELVARAAVLAILNLIVPGSAMAVSAHKALGAMIPLGGGGGKQIFANNKMEFKIHGKDLKTVLQRAD